MTTIPSGVPSKTVITGSIEPFVYWSYRRHEQPLSRTTPLITIAGFEPLVRKDRDCILAGSTARQGEFARLYSLPLLSEGQLARRVPAGG